MSKLFKRQGNYLHPLPTMEAPEVKNGDYFLAYGPIKRYEEHLKACETDKILIGEGLKKIIKEGQIVEEGKDFKKHAAFYDAFTDTNSHYIAVPIAANQGDDWKNEFRKVWGNGLEEIGPRIIDWFDKHYTIIRKT